MRTRRVQLNSNGYLVGALVVHGYLVGIIKAPNFCVRFLRPFPFGTSIIKCRRDLVPAFVFVLSELGLY